MGRGALPRSRPKRKAAPEMARCSRNRKDAQRELARLLNEMSTGAYVEPARMSVGEFLDRWLADYAKPKVSPKTYERYQEMIEGHIRPALGSYLLPKLAPLHIQASTVARWPRDGRTAKEGSRRKASCTSIGCCTRPSPRR